MNCSICGKESELYLCENCVRTHNDHRTIEIWEQNKELANSLGKAYYKPTLKSYDKKNVKKDSKENLGFNLFCDGINLGLDTTMPFLDDEKLVQTKNKIAELIETRKKLKEMKK